MKKYNKVLHLTSKNANIDKIIEESLLINQFIKKGSLVLDVGAGSGIVGIPLKIIREDITIYFLERSEKKTIFLENVIKTLNLKDSFVLNVDYRFFNCEKKFDVIVARAVGNYESVIKHLRSALNENGKFVIFSDIDYPSTHKEKYKFGKLTITIIDF